MLLCHVLGLPWISFRDTFLFSLLLRLYSRDTVDVFLGRGLLPHVTEQTGVRRCCPHSPGSVNSHTGFLARLTRIRPEPRQNSVTKPSFLLSLVPNLPSFLFFLRNLQDRRDWEVFGDLKQSIPFSIVHQGSARANGLTYK